MYKTNEPRFCCKYVKKVGAAQEIKKGWNYYLSVGDKYYIFCYGNSHKVGDKVLMAKKIPLPGKKWNIHEIVLVEDYWYYKCHCDKTAKEQRTYPYEPRVKTYFGRGRRFVQEVSLDYIKKNFK